MRYKSIFFLLIFLLSNSNIVSAQSIFNLIGDTIIIPGPFPEEFTTYYKKGSPKHSIKEKNIYKGRITGMPIVINNIEEVEKGGTFLKPKDYVLIDVKDSTDCFLLKIPLYYKYEEFDPMASEILDRYYSRWISHEHEAMLSILESEKYYRCLVRDLKIPHYKVSDINALKKHLKNKRFVKKNSSETIIIKDLIENTNAPYLVVLENSSNKNDTIYLKYNDSKEEKEFFSIQYLKENFYDEDSLISELELSPRYKRINELRDSVMNKCIHINNSNEFYAFNPETSERAYLSEHKFYFIKDIVIMRDPQSYETKYNFFTLVQEQNDASKVYAFQFHEYDFQHNIVDAVIYLKRRKERIKEEQELFKKQQKEKKERAIQLSEQRRKYKEKLITKYGEENAQLILKGKIRLGFSKEMVRASWGSPWDTTRVTNKFGVLECWIYNYDTSVLFENGNVVQIIN